MEMSTTNSTERNTTAAFPALRLTAFAGVSATSRREGNKQKQCGEILGSRLGCRARLSILETTQRSGSYRASQKVFKSDRGLWGRAVWRYTLQDERGGNIRREMLAPALQKKKEFHDLVTLESRQAGRELHN
jgi:hypothetical protein